MIKCVIIPLMEINNNEKCELKLIDFVLHNLIPNIKKSINNIMYFGNDKTIELPTGSYEKYCNLFKNYSSTDNINIFINANNTLKNEMFSNV